MRFPAVALLSAVTVFAGTWSAHAQPATATAALTASATFDARTSLIVSSRVLHFHVGEAGGRALASVDFVAAARTRAGGEILLTVEPAQLLEADEGAGVSFAGEGAGTTAGLLSDGPALAGRWVGSGRRAGRLEFELRAAAPGVYSLPVRFALSAP